MARKPSYGNLPVPKKNFSGMSVAELVLQDMQNELLAETEARKNNSLENNYFQYADNPRGFVQDILKNPLVTEEQIKLLESVRDNPITLARSANAVGKTFIAAYCAIWFYKIFSGRGVQVYTTTIPEKNLRTILWKEISGVIEKNSSLFLQDSVRLSSLSVKFSAEEFIDGVTIPQSGDDAHKQARFSGKHAPYLLFIVDEGDSVPAAIYKAIESCMSGGFARLLILFNPRQETGPLYQFEKSGSANVIELSAFTHPNVISGREIIPGAVTREVTVRRINEWTRPIITGEKVDKDVFMVPSFLVGYVATKKDGKTLYPPLHGGIRKIIEPAFSYMVLGKYSAQAENQLINRNDIKRAQDNWKKYVERFGNSRSGVQPKVGLDVAELGSDFNVLTPKYDNFVDTQEIWGGVDTLVTANNTNDTMLRLGAKEAFIDSNGLGAGVWPTVRAKGFTAHRIMVQESPTKEATTGGTVIGQFQRIRDQGWWELREWLRINPDAAIPLDEELEEQLLAATYSRDKNGKIKICDNDVMKSRLNGKSPDKASSLMLLFCPENDESGASELESNEY